MGIYQAIRIGCITTVGVVHVLQQKTSVRYPDTCMHTCKTAVACTFGSIPLKFHAQEITVVCVLSIAIVTSTESCCTSTDYCSDPYSLRLDPQVSHTVI